MRGVKIVPGPILIFPAPVPYPVGGAGRSLKREAGLRLKSRFPSIAEVRQLFRTRATTWRRAAGRYSSLERRLLVRCAREGRICYWLNSFLFRDSNSSRDMIPRSRSVASFSISSATFAVDLFIAALVLARA